MTMPEISELRKSTDPGHGQILFHEWASCYIGAKAAHDLSALCSLFADDIDYEDAVLARRSSGAGTMRATYAKIFDKVGASAGSTLLWAAGAEAGGAVQIENDPGLFGSAMKVVAVIELDGGRVARQRDYWNGRAFPTETLTGMRATYPPHLAPEELIFTQRSTRNPTLAAAAVAFWAAADGPAFLRERLASDIALTDITCGVAVKGIHAVTSFLRQRGESLPYGPGAHVINVVGGADGGAWEWAASDRYRTSVGAGVAAVRLRDGLVSELTLCWDGSRLTAPEWARLSRFGDAS